MAQVWANGPDGGFMYSDKLSAYLRMELLNSVKFRQFMDIKESEAIGKHKGDRWYWNVYSKVAVKGTVLDENLTMPKTQFSITQRSGVITEHGNSVDYTGKLDDLSEHPVREVIHKVLKIDAKEAMDVASWAQLERTPLRVAPLAGNNPNAIVIETAGTSTITNNVPFGKGHVQPVVTSLKERGVPPFINDDYYAVGWPSTFDTLRDQLEGVQQYVETGLALLMNGEVGRWRGMRFVEQSHIPKGGAADSATFDPQTETADPWNGGASDWRFFLGSDVGAEGIAVLEEIRGKIPQDYGRDRGIAWYSLNGFGLSHPDAANARVMKWDSAA